MQAHPGHAAGLPDLRALFADDPTDSHTWRRFVRDRGESPERCLALAVMTQALLDLRLPEGRAHGKDAGVYERTWAWFQTNDRGWPLAFVSICEMFDWSPEAVRARVLGRSPEPLRLVPRRQQS